MFVCGIIEFVKVWVPSKVYKKMWRIGKQNKKKLLMVDIELWVKPLLELSANIPHQMKLNQL